MLIEFEVTFTDVPEGYTSEDVESAILEHLTLEREGESFTIDLDGSGEAEVEIDTGSFWQTTEGK